MGGGGGGDNDGLEVEGIHDVRGSVEDIIEMRGRSCVLAGRASFVVGRVKIVARAAAFVAGVQSNFGGRGAAIEMRRSGIRKYFSEINSRNQYNQ